VSGVEEVEGAEHLVVDGRLSENERVDDHLQCSDRLGDGEHVVPLDGESALTISGGEDGQDEDEGDEAMDSQEAEGGGSHGRCDEGTGALLDA
jgi:hypothetical protein